MKTTQGNAVVGVILTLLLFTVSSCSDNNQVQEEVSNETPNFDDSFSNPTQNVNTSDSSILEDENLVHKLNLANKYIACAHISCDHSHAIPQFLICRQCTKCVEINIDKATIGEIQKKVENADFQLTKPQLEMHCICNDCK